MVGWVGWTWLAGTGVTMARWLSGRQGGEPPTGGAPPETARVDGYLSTGPFLPTSVAMANLTERNGRPQRHFGCGQV